MRAYLPRAPLAPDHDHLAGVSANRAALEREDARILVGEELASHGCRLMVAIKHTPRKRR
jgi:hypothetical protein